MDNSILQKEECCLVCRKTYPLQTHHPIEGSRRRISDRYGMTVQLCPKCHMRVHNNEQQSRELKAWAQKKAMEHYGWSTEDFVNAFGKSYITEEAVNGAGLLSLLS